MISKSLKNVLKLLLLPVLSIPAFASNSFFVGHEMDEKRLSGLSYVMEKVTASNYDSWLQYAKVQSSRPVIGYIDQTYKLDITDGSYAFSESLKDYGLGKGEIWIAYVTSNLHPAPISKDVIDYGSSSFINTVYEDQNSFTRDLQMCMTVQTHPDSLITSHVGIFATAESFERGRVGGLSTSLYAYAAQVMLKLNPERRYTINTPATGMREILLNKLPEKSVFAGTQQMAETLQARTGMTQEQFLGAHPKVTQKAWESVSRKQKNLNRRLKKMNKHPEDYDEEEQAEFRSNYEEAGFILHEGEIVPVKEKVEGKISLRLAEEFEHFQNPYVIKRSFSSPKRKLSRGEYTQEIMAMFNKHPSVMSVEKNEKGCLEQISLFDSNNLQEAPFLTFNKKDPAYRWFFNRVIPGGITFYVAIDLKKLALAHNFEVK